MIVASVLISAMLQVQQINCFPNESGSTDRVVISLQIPDRASDLPDSGTLFLSLGLDDAGNQDSAGPFPLKLVPESDEDAQKGLVRYQAQDDSSAFVVVIAQKDIGRAQKDFPLVLELMRLSGKYSARESLNCYSTVFNASNRTAPLLGTTSER